ncbi:coatomer WD associated region-domain-containing protein [Gorgonomyces haynaldii]|nr:coatomer WD associated region-domain-containing protein [Gorgonomyces haynaldii]
MPLRLDIKRKLSNRSERVKAVDYHPTEPWLLTALYNGAVHIWNYETQALVKTFETSELPVRAAKFISRKSWIVTGSDDLQVRVFNYNTLEKVTSFEAHVDYIRGIAVHPTLPYILTCSDDQTIKMWNWEKGWKLVQTFEGHTHFVMQVVFNPKDGNTFASACMDRTVKIWSLGSPVANFTLEGHQKGVNSVDYYPEGDKPYLVTSGDDKLIKVWDYQNKTCVQTLEGHSNNVTVVQYHPTLPIIISGSEDGTVRIWHANTYRLENTLNYGMERVWAMASLKGSHDVAFAYDDGTVSIQLGKDEPSISMDTSGKIIWSKHNEIQTANIKSNELDPQDGESILLSIKDLGSCEIYPQSLVHSPNGRFVVVCGDGEFIIYTALAWRNKAFGQGLEFVWAQDSNEYCVRESTSRVRLFKNFKEKNVNIRFSYSAEGIYGGTLLGIKSAQFIVFYDWETGNVVRKVDSAVKHVFWSESDLVCIAGEDAFYVLKFNRQAYQQGEATEDGVEDAFEFVTEIQESVLTGCWIGDCFIYSSTANRLSYLVGVQTSNLSHFGQPVYVLGYLSHNNRIIVADKNVTITSYALPLTMVEYQTAILRGDLQHAQSVLPTVPQEHYNKIARFLEAQGHVEMALEISTDPEHRFDLAMALGHLQIAYQIASEVDHEDKWKQIGDVALNSWNFGLALEAWKRANDLESLFLIYQASGNHQGLSELGQQAYGKGEVHLAFQCYLLTQNHEGCLQLLVEAKRFPEAAFYCRTHLPTKMTEVAGLWRQDLIDKKKERLASMITDPQTAPELFPEHVYGIAAQMHRDAQPVHAAREYPLPDVNLAQELMPRFKPENVLDAVKQLIVAQTNGKHSPQSPPKPASQPVQPVQARPQSPPKPAVQPVPPVEQVQAKPPVVPAAVPPAQSKPVAQPIVQTTLVEPVQQKPPRSSSPVQRQPSPDRSSPDRSSPLAPVQKPPSNGPKKKKDDVELISDTVSHLSMEVNTTGTGSMKGDVDFDFDEFDTQGDVPPLDESELENMLI